jgi:ribonuclease BN (tRNA processing enzyme)
VARDFPTRAALVLLCLFNLGAADPAVPDPPAASRVTLLGTGGGPIARASRSQPANLIVVRGHHYLVDAGDGTLRQLATLGVRPNRIDDIFITHLHFDHTAGLPAFMALDWQDQRRAPVGIFGPPGTVELVRRGLATFESAVNIFRPQLPDLPDFASLFQPHDLDVTTPRVVFRNADMTVTAVENSHYSTMTLPARSYGRDRSYSYRFDLPDRSIVFTGDTGPSPAVERLARGADVLVSEVIDLPAILRSLRARAHGTATDEEPLVAHMTREHLTPEEVGRLATRAGVGKVVLTHIAEPPGVEQVDAASLVAGVRSTYRGDVVLGNDLDSF